MEKKQTVYVNIDVATVLYDVRNKAYLTGNSRMASGTVNYEAGSKMQASEDDEETDQLKRSLTTYYAGLKSKLGEYLDEDFTTSDNLTAEAIEDEGTLSLAFRLPSNYSKAGVDALGAGIHAYLVDMVLADWYTITNPADVSGYVEHAGVMLEDVRSALYRRSRPTRPERPKFNSEDGKAGDS